MVVTGIEEGTQVVSEVELKLAEHQDLPDELDDLERVHQELLDIQQIIQDHQVRSAVIEVLSAHAKKFVCNIFVRLQQKGNDMNMIFFL